MTDNAGDLRWHLNDGQRITAASKTHNKLVLADSSYFEFSIACWKENFRSSVRSLSLRFLRGPWLVPVLSHPLVPFRVLRHIDRATCRIPLPLLFVSHIWHSI
jgi:hypothetical protein